MLEALTAYINDRYGSRRGCMNHWRFCVQLRLGVFAQYAAIDWSRVENLVFICHGNICRSPLGEAVARQQYHLQSESFGLDCTDGALADPRAQAFAQGIGVDLSQHASRHIRDYEPQPCDLIVVMEPKHILQLPPLLSVTQITLVGLWLDRPQPYVHDPFSSSPHHFNYCEELVVRGVKGMAERINKK